MMMMVALTVYLLRLFATETNTLCLLTDVAKLKQGTDANVPVKIIQQGKKSISNQVSSIYCKQHIWPLRSTSGHMIGRFLYVFWTKVLRHEHTTIQYEQQLLEIFQVIKPNM
ncbi:unnamed protein product, partial [Meganyctiphanes norvegica]